MKTIVKILIGMLLVVFLGFGVVQIRRIFAKPLAEPLSINTVSQQKATEVVTKSPTVKATAVSTMPVAPEGMCGNTGSIQILLTGADYSMGMPPFGADAIRLIQIDFDNATVKSVAFPRALVVKTDALGDPQKTVMELGTSYYEMKQAAQGTNTDKVTAATNLLAQVLYDNFGVNPNYYLTLQLDSVGAMIDEIGGVEITLPEAITTERKVTFPAGTQTLNGRLAAEFVRSRQPGGETARLQRQEILINSLQKKIFSASAVIQVPDLIQQFHGAIVTDLSPEQILSLTCAIEQIPLSSERYYNIMNEEYINFSEDGALIPNEDEIKNFLSETLGK